jgi:HSP20 family protein
MRDLTIRRLNNYPFNFFNDLDDDFKQLFRQTDLRSSIDNSFSPAFEIAELEEATFISTDLPGVNKEDISIEFKDGFLSISGERKSELKENNYTEKKYGKFQRTFKLPKNLDTEKIEAKFENGVLTLAIPKKEEVQSKKVEIKINDKNSIFENLKNDIEA